MKAQIDEYPYILTEDKDLPENQQTVFTLTPLTFKQDTWLENRQANNMPDGDVIAAILHMGIKSVTNLIGQNGEQIKPERTTTNELS